MRVECPCGELIKDRGNPSARFASILPSQADDDHAMALENAFRRHQKDVDAALQWAAHDTAHFFRRICQCAKCGRIFIEDADYRTHEFVPADLQVSTNLLARYDVPS